MGKGKEKKTCEMEMRVKLLEAHQEFIRCMDELGTIWLNIQQNNNQFLYSRVAEIIGRMTQSVEFLGMNVDNNY